jgi:hypothetical protein
MLCVFASLSTPISLIVLNCVPLLPVGGPLHLHRIKRIPLHQPITSPQTPFLPQRSLSPSLESILPITPPIAILPPPLHKIRHHKSLLRLLSHLFLLTRISRNPTSILAFVEVEVRFRVVIVSKNGGFTSFLSKFLGLLVAPHGPDNYH